MQELVSQERMAYELWKARSPEERLAVHALYRCLVDEDEDASELHLQYA